MFKLRIYQPKLKTISTEKLLQLTKNAFIEKLI